MTSATARTARKARPSRRCRTVSAAAAAIAASLSNRRLICSRQRAVVHPKWRRAHFQLNSVRFSRLLSAAAPDEAPAVLSVTPHTTTSVLICWKVSDLVCCAARRARACKSRRISSS